MAAGGLRRVIGILPDELNPALLHCGMPSAETMLTRRDIFKAGVAAAAALPANAAAPRITISDLRTISLQPEFYHGWPTLTQSKKGDLLLAYSGGRESHVCPFGRVDLMRSPDGGKNWSWPETLMDTAIDDRDAGICETASGALLVTTFTSLTYESRTKGFTPEQKAKWDAVARRITQQQRNSLQDTWMLRSPDGGVTWSAPYRVPLNSPHGPVSVKGGRLLYAGKKVWDPAGRIGVCESTDDGLTWRWLADIPTRPGDKSTNYHELHMVEAANGHLVAHVRNHNPQNDRETLQSESTDGGKTWTVPHPIGVWGLPSHLLKLRDGRLLMSYGYRRAPFGNQVRISADHGKTWSEPATLSDDAPGVDVGYPSTVERADGALVTVWYETTKKDPLAVLRQATWSLS